MPSGSLPVALFSMTGFSMRSPSWKPYQNWRLNPYFYYGYLRRNKKKGQPYREVGAESRGSRARDPGQPDCRRRSSLRSQAASGFSFFAQGLADKNDKGSCEGLRCGSRIGARDCARGQQGVMHMGPLLPSSGCRRSLLVSSIWAFDARTQRVLTNGFLGHCSDRDAWRSLR